MIAQRVGERAFLWDASGVRVFGEKTGSIWTARGEGILRPLSQWNDKEYTADACVVWPGNFGNADQLLRDFCCFVPTADNRASAFGERCCLSPDGTILRIFVSEERNSPPAAFRPMAASYTVR